MSINNSKKRACVVVLGDFERSPRMKYHTLSLVKSGYDVDVVAYFDTSLSPETHQEHKIHLHPMRDFTSCYRYLPRLLSYFLKAFLQSISLLCTLMIIKKPDFFLLQNPPSIPTLPIVYFVSRLRGTKFIIDWHNYGFTILALSLNPNHLLVRLCRMIEGIFGSRADHNFCVSQAMAKDLKHRWNVEAVVLYDRPTPGFLPLNIGERCEFLEKIAQIYPEFRSDDGEGSKLCQIIEGKCEERSDRPVIIISGTSWTEDEDFNILLGALDEYDGQSDSSLPYLICVITGKGPLKDYYSNIISRRGWHRVSVITPWLSSEDYPKMVASADLGISLHTSSSNLDLPMKIIDMFGCAVPVLAITYDCLNELLSEGYNGLTFRNSKDLLAHFLKLLKSPRHQISSMQDNLRKNRPQFSWDTEWAKKMGPIISSKFD
ncbi:ALG1, chitobiosyldiphosphodolichol beta-mannosyltransferase [Brevipalpus obovatus]|uniref:ALG1, chitobiosyldiphosphodolichol beta-mannosyltransferase n=1 Tax=Brevipalpus obovatus TaxID=246614 RepID=UPI003D9F4DE0